MTKFDFTHEELQLNKKWSSQLQTKGSFEGHGAQYSQQFKKRIMGNSFFLVFGMGIMGAVALKSMDARTLQTLGPQMLAGWCFTIVAVLTVYSLSIFFSFRRAAKMEVAPVLSAEGIISHDSDYSSNAGLRSYYVYFGKKRFSFPDEMNRTFPEGSTFRIYYCKVGQIELIMSFERLS